jgi:hypothetical protein
MHPLQLLLRAVKAQPVEHSIRDTASPAMAIEHREEY